MPVVAIPCAEIVDFDTFHSVFARALGFPDFYGRNMNAWIDCMSDPGMTNLPLEDTSTLVLQLVGAASLAERCPDVMEALVDCTAFVNGRATIDGLPLLELRFAP